MKSHVGAVVTIVAVLELCSSAFAWAQSDAESQGSKHVEITLAYEEQEQLRQQLQRVLSRYDLEPWIFTRKVRVDEGIPHSHPVLTMTTQPEYLASDLHLMSAFVHEQIHWFAEANEAAVGEAVDELRERYPEVPVRGGQGARSEESTYLHLIVNWLEYDAMVQLVGREEARQILSTMDHYEWIYERVLQDREEIGVILARHGLLITPEQGLVVQGGEE